MPDKLAVFQAVFFIALLCAASVTDLTKRIIPNWLCLGIAGVSIIGFTPVKLLGILIALPFLLAAVFFGGMAVGFMMLPFWYVQLTASHFKKDIAAELETALSIVTTAYLRSENILTAVEENLNYLNPPVHQVFKDFVLRVKLIDPDVLEAIKVLRTKIDNEVFREWCDALCDCQHGQAAEARQLPMRKSSLLSVLVSCGLRISLPSLRRFLCMITNTGSTPR